MTLLPTISRPCRTASSVLLPLALLLLSVTGCSTVRERYLEPPPPQVRVFPGDGRAVYVAALKAVEESGFRYIRGGPAQGFFEAEGAVTAQSGPTRAQQLAVRVKLTEGEPGFTEVAVWLKRVEEDESLRPPMNRESHLPRSGFHTAFFDRIEKQLAGL